MQDVEVKISGYAESISRLKRAGIPIPEISIEGLTDTYVVGISYRILGEQKS
jgi:hypothetical protein